MFPEMSPSPAHTPCPVYVPATQVTPDSIDDVPNTQICYLTQEDQRTLLFDDNSDTGTSTFDSSASTTDSIISNVRNRNIDHSARDYYRDLFSSDSDNSETFSVSTPSVFSSDSTPISPCNLETPEQSSSPTNDLPSNIHITNMGYPAQEVLQPLENILSSSEIDNLLGYEQPIPKCMEQQISPTQHIDKIASFNIQNKYEHTPAAELLINENLAFISFQEPYGAQNQPESTWKTYAKCELHSARIDCYETQFQIILIDTWKWGGKSISPLQSSHNGRLIWTAFNLGKNNTLGIISIYASSAEIHGNCSDGINSEIIESIKNIRCKWQEDFPDINIMFLGDLQETCSNSDRDNVGTFRKIKNENGILAYLERTHESIVRKHTNNDAYVTRFGTSGARGIDHILTPSTEAAQSVFPSAKIKRNAGATFFSSDHSLIICEFSRSDDKNNNEDSQETVDYNYSKIYRIKVKNEGENGQDIVLDEKQFKGSEMYREQVNIYIKVAKSNSR